MVSGGVSTNHIGGGTISALQKYDVPIFLAH